MIFKNKRDGAAFVSLSLNVFDRGFPGEGVILVRQRSVTGSGQSGR